MAIYLHDHSGGAQHAILLLRFFSRRSDRLLGELARALLPEIEADHQTLQELMARFDVRPSTFKRLSALGGIGALRLKLRRGQRASEAFAALEALEFLSLGIRGKEGLWRALALLAECDPRIDPEQMSQLLDRARQQFDLVERHRLSVAHQALGTRLS